MIWVSCRPNALIFQPVDLDGVRQILDASGRNVTEALLILV